MLPWERMSRDLALGRRTGSQRGVFGSRRHGDRSEKICPEVAEREGGPFLRKPGSSSENAERGDQLMQGTQGAWGLDQGQGRKAVWLGGVRVAKGHSSSRCFTPSHLHHDLEALVSSA